MRENKLKQAGTLPAPDVGLAGGVYSTMLLSPLGSLFIYSAATMLVPIDLENRITSHWDGTIELCCHGRRIRLHNAAPGVVARVGVTPPVSASVTVPRCYRSLSVCVYSAESIEAAGQPEVGSGKTAMADLCVFAAA